MVKLYHKQLPTQPMEMLLAPSCAISLKDHVFGPKELFWNYVLHV